MEQERQAAIRDLTAGGYFRPANNDRGPYGVKMSVEDGRLVFRMNDVDGQDLTTHVLALGPYRRLILDYFLMIESYEQARNGGTCGKLEAIDMGRRGLHDEGARLLRERLSGKIEMDHDTARRLFTLICSLYRGPARLVA